jgi:NADPH:quinone reductase
MSLTVETRVATMQAAVIAAPGTLEIQSVPIQQPEGSELRIKLQGSGVCASNIPPWEGREWFEYPMAPGALGHEGWGLIDAVGPDVAEFRVGQWVAFLSNNSYAEYDFAKADSVVPLPEALEGEPFPGEPLGCAMNIFRRSGIGRGDSVAIVGIGFLGCLLAQLATGVGAKVIALDRKASSLETAKRMGATEAILLDDHWRVLAAAKDLTHGRFCDVVIEATGKPWPLDIAAELTKERGRLVVAGYHQDGLRQVNMQLWNWRGLDVINAHEREHAVYIQGIRDAISAVVDGRLRPRELYTHRFPLSELGQALDMTKTRPEGFMKALVVMEN